MFLLKEVGAIKFIYFLKDVSINYCKHFFFLQIIPIKISNQILIS